MNKKNYFWSNFRGILILLIVFGQFLYLYALKRNGSSADVIYTFLNTFCFPAFIFSLGYLSKPNKARSKTTQITLLLYYLFFNTAMLLGLYLLKGTEVSLLSPTNSYWLVISLIVWRASVESLSKIKGIIPIAAAAALLIGFWEEFSNILSIRRTVAYFVFFLLGYKFDREKFKNMLRSRTLKKYLIALAVTCIGIFVLFCIVKRYNITISMLQMEAYKKPIHVLHRAFLMAVSVCAIISLMMLTPTANLAVLTTLGRNSMLIYLTHRFFTTVFNYVLPYKRFSNSYIVYAAIGTAAACALFGDNKVNRLINGITERAALHIVNDDKRGKILQTGIMLGFLLLLAAIPIIEMLRG